MTIQAHGNQPSRAGVCTPVTRVPSLVLLCAVSLAGAVVGPDRARGDEPRKIRGALLLDGRPWAGGRAVLVPVDHEKWTAPSGPAVEVVADARGAFVAAMTAGPWRVHGDPSWPGGASLRCELGEPPHAPGDDLVWVGSANTCRALIHDEDDPLIIDVLSPVNVAGEVVDRSGQPVAFASVAVESAGSSRPLVEGTTNVDGVFVVRVPAWLARTGGSALVARAAGRALAAASVGLVSDDEGRVSRPRSVTLVLGAAPLACEGVVTDLDGRPVPGARLEGELRLMDARGADQDDTVGVRVAATCDERGAFRFEAAGGVGWLSAGPAFAAVEVDVVAPGFEREGTTVVFGPRVGVPSVRLRRADLPLAGVVLDGAGSPLAGASVLVDRVEVRSGSDGRFELFASELCDLTVLAPGHAPRALRARLPLTTLTVALGRVGPPITGRLVDARGRPLAAHQVTAETQHVFVLNRTDPHPDVGAWVERPLAEVRPGMVQADAQTDADGNFRLDELPPGVDLVVRVPGAAPETARAGASLVLSGEVETTTSVNVQEPATSTSTLTLTVRWPDVPVRGVVVEWTDLDGRERGDWCPPARVDETTWALAGLAPGDVELRFTPVGVDHRRLAPVVLRVRVSASEATRVELDLREQE